jgi:hypothetical protein
MTCRFVRLSLALAMSATAARAIPAASAQQPARLKNGDVLSGELLAMRSHAKGKRTVTFQLTAGPYRLPGPDGLCNLETGPETFQLVTNSEAEVTQLKKLVGKTVSVKANAITCSDSAGQMTDAIVTQWSVVN